MAKITAIVSTNDKMVDGGAPIFIVPDEHQLQEMAFLLEKILDASAHDLKNGVFILVDHK
ncbi:MULTISPECIES: capping complex subunit for YIEGIA [unclassified Paenibacillus]|uniref:capping complex subunit for YIEGIA n=1 Tax=unclassified Paenibacillus TaxID=185978 RepID=UPI002F42A19E